ncbi:MAG: hypothetical protein L0027_10300, partial [Candidatus Rokubacteria bacterium]|nr:hypothetical protein [Candidatus Rokubacteria bacterium]
LDQAAFDTMAAAGGFPTFSLADHFRFEFSPLLLTDAPEPPPGPGPGPSPVSSPSAIALASLGAGGLVLAHCLRQRRTVARPVSCVRRLHCPR